VGSVQRRQAESAVIVHSLVSSSQQGDNRVDQTGAPRGARESKTERSSQKSYTHILGVDNFFLLYKGLGLRCRV